MHGRYVLFVFVLFSCAQVRDITGGEKDVTSPQLIMASPANGTVNFNGRNIRLEFDERIQLDRVRERMMISPPLEETPQVRIVGSRALEIALAAPLLQNTTYTFNLSECVKDLTEGNFASGLVYVLSTGPHLDSARVSGAVINAYSGAPEKDMLVMLYPEADSNTFREGRPSYLARTNSLGVFEIGHLPKHQFAMFALRDKNGNLRYDLPNEEIAFLDTSVRTDIADSLQSPYLMRAFLPASATQQIRQYRVVPDGALELILARPGDTLIISDLARTGGSLSWSAEWGRGRDTVLLWPSDTTLLSEGRFSIRDSQDVLDTILYRPISRMPFHTQLTASLIEREAGPRIKIRASRPIREFDLERTILTVDSISVPLTMERGTGDQRTIFLDGSIPPGSTASLSLLPKAVRDVYGGTNDSLLIPIGRASEKAVGTLRVVVHDLKEGIGYLALLLDNQQRTVRTSSVSIGATSILWTHLPPGQYAVQLIADLNGNGRWDTGEWKGRIQPERTWRHPDPVNVRAAWDVTVDWTLAP